MEWIYWLVLSCLGLAILVQLFIACTTTCETNNIKFVVAGEKRTRIIHAMTGKKLVARKFVPGVEEEAVITKLFGRYWVGIPYLRSIHNFPIQKEKERSRITADMPVEDWIISDDEKTIVDSLRGSFPRPYLDLEVELHDGFSVHIFIGTNWEVVEPDLPIFKYKGDFFTNLGSMFLSGVNDIVKTWEIEEFLAQDKSEDGFLKKFRDDTDPVMSQIIKEIGLRLTSASVIRWDPSNQKTRDYLEARAAAEKVGKAKIEAAEQAKKEKIINAEADAKALMIKSEAERDSQKMLAEGRLAGVQAVVKGLGATNGDVGAVSAAEILKMEAATGKDSKIQTLVTGGGASVVIPTTENKK